MREKGNSRSRFTETVGKIGMSLLKLFGGDFPVFLLFLGMTFFFWWSRAMSASYDMDLKVPVRLTDIPESIRVTNLPDSYITVRLSGKGGALKKSSKWAGENVLSLSATDFRMQGGHASVNASHFRDTLDTRLPQSVQVRIMEPDSITFTYELQRTVMAPVEFGGTMESRDQFFMQSIVFEPDSIEMKVLLSDTVVHHAVAVVGTLALDRDTITLKAGIEPAPGVIFGTDQVGITVISEQYTEKTLEIPVTGVNFPHDTQLRSFPRSISVSAWVRMSDYESISAQDFRVVVDYNEISGQNSPHATLHIFSQPANVRNVRVQPRVVDYLIETSSF